MALSCLSIRTLAVALGCAVLGCGSAEAVPIDVGPTGPASIAFSDPPPLPTPACRAIGADVTARVPLLLTLSNVILRPPGACGSYQQCGHLRLLAGGVLNNEGAAKAIDLLAGKLANPYGTLTIRVELVNDFDKPMLAKDGRALAAEIQLTVAKSCS